MNDNVGLGTYFSNMFISETIYIYFFWVTFNTCRENQGMMRLYQSDSVLDIQPLLLRRKQHWSLFLMFRHAFLFLIILGSSTKLEPRNGWYLLILISKCELFKKAQPLLRSSNSSIFCFKVEHKTLVNMESKLALNFSSKGLHWLSIIFKQYENRKKFKVNFQTSMFLFFKRFI